MREPRLGAIALCGALLGCEYHPGSFRYGGDARIFEGRRATVGCLDVSVERRVDRDDHAVLAYRFGNRCNQPVEVDLQHANVIGRRADGGEVALAPYDPNLEVRPLELPARRAGGEVLAYQIPAATAISQVCVDLASIVKQPAARWQCFHGDDAAPDEISRLVSGSTP